MNYSEAKKKIKNEYENLLKPLGYKSRSNGQGFEFNFVKNNLVLKIGFGVSNYSDQFDTGCYASIGVIEIHNVLNYIFDEKLIIIDRGNTIGVNIAKYFNEINYSFNITTDEDVAEWGVIVRKYFYEYLSPFFEKYNSIASIDILFNEYPTETVIFMDNLASRIQIGLISAKLNQNPKYNELRNYYKSEVESKFQGYFMYTDCMKVIDFLDSHTYEEIKEISEL